LESGKSAACPPLATDPRLPLVRTFLRAAGQRKPAGVNYFCDAAVLAGSGMASVVFGPGDIAQAHTADEWVASSSLEGAVRLLLKFFQALPS
jgi:acetylornithine deacetylase